MKVFDVNSNVFGCVITNHTAIAVLCGCGGYHINNIAAAITVMNYNLQIVNYNKLQKIFSYL